MTGFFYTTCTDCNSLRLHTVEPLSDITTDPDTVTLKRSELCRAIGLLQACKDWKENAASTEALKILETALKEGV